MSYTARPPFTGGMSNQNQQQQQGGQPNNANIGASGIPNIPMMNNAAASKLKVYFSEIVRLFGCFVVFLTERSKENMKMNLTHLN